VVGDTYAEITEPEARASAQAETGYGADAEMLNQPDPGDAYVFYESPADFGGVAVVSADTGLTVFGASIVWAGKGDIEFPTSWRDPAELGPGCPGMYRSRLGPGPGYDLCGINTGPEPFTLAESDIEAALDVLHDTGLPDAVWYGGYVFGSVVLCYPRKVGVFDPGSAEWIVLVNGGWLE
jgi:hypothetical protein